MDAHLRAGLFREELAKDNVLAIERPSGGAEASTLLRQSEQLAERLYGRNSPRLPWIWHEEALLALSDNRPAIAEGLLNKALAVATPSPQGAIEILTFQNDLGLALVEERRYSEAEALLLKVSQQEKQDPLANTLDQASNLAHLGLLRERQKEFPEASRYYQSALTICDSIGAIGPVLIEILNANERVVRSSNPALAKSLKKRAAAVARSAFR